MSRKVETFSQFEEHDRAVSEWFAQRGWSVTARFIDDDRDVFACRHEAEKRADQRTLRVTHNVLEDTSPHILIEFMNGTMLADVLSTTPAKYVVIQQNAAGVTKVEVFDSTPQ